MTDFIKSLISKSKTVSFIPSIISVDRNIIKVTIDGEETEEFEDEVYIVKDPTDRDFYVFTENLQQIDNVDCQFTLDTDYNMVSTAFDTGTLDFVSSNFTEELNTEDYFEFFKRGNVVDLHINCTDNM